MLVWLTGEASDGQPAELTTQYYNQITPDQTEDGAAFLSLLSGALIHHYTTDAEYKVHNRLYVKTDGAGCYSGSDTMLGLACIGASIDAMWDDANGDKPNCRVEVHYVSGAGDGKSMLDAWFGVSGQKVDRSVVSGMGAYDVCDPHTLVDALNAGGGVLGCHSRVWTITRSVLLENRDAKKKKVLDDEVKKCLSGLAAGAGLSGLGVRVIHERAYLYSGEGNIPHGVALSRQSRCEADVIMMFDDIPSWKDLLPTDLVNPAEVVVLTEIERAVLVREAARVNVAKTPAARELLDKSKLEKKADKENLKRNK
jgi:hypothetical protein